MANPFSMEGRRVVIFGGAGYIGGETVKMLLELGAKVVCADIKEEDKAFATYLKDVKGAPGLVYLRCDLAKVEDVRAAYDLCVKSFGGFDTMMNLVVYGRYASIDKQTDEDWAYCMEGVIGQVFRATREVLPYFEKNGGGVIVNTASMYGLVSPDYKIYGTSGQNSPPAYGAGKAAVVNFTRYSAAHLAPKGIRVNAVAPGPIPDPAKNPPPEFLGELSKKTMLQRIGKPQEVAGAFCYLASDAASFTTGHTLVVDGGWTTW